MFIVITFEMHDQDVSYENVRPLNRNIQSGNNLFIYNTLISQNSHDWKSTGVVKQVKL